jgi:hypothetical protein
MKGRQLWSPLPLVYWLSPLRRKRADGAPYFGVGEGGVDTSHERLVSSSHSRPPSPRLPLLSPSPSMTMLAPPVLVVPSTLPLHVCSTSPSSQVVWPPLFLLAHVTSGSHVSSCSHSPSTEDMSKRSPGYIMTDSEDDRQHGYAIHVPKRQKLMTTPVAMAG